jgi:hypothetical protein
LAVRAGPPRLGRDAWGKRQLVPEILFFVSSQIVSPDRGARRGAIIALGTCAEGCAESYTENLEMLLPWLLKGMADEDAGVRSWACWTLTQFAEFLQAWPPPPPPAARSKAATRDPKSETLHRESQA